MSQSLIYSGFVFLLLYSLVDACRGGSEFKRIFLFLAVLFLSFLTVVTQYAFDVSTYRRVFYRLSESPESWRIDLFPEYGFQYLNYVVNGILGQDFEFFRFWFAFITISLTILFSRLHTNKSGIFLYFYYPKYFLTGVVSHVRSSFVYPFIFLYVKLVEARKTSLALLLTIPLSQIHLLALILNVIILLKFVRLSTSLVVLTIPISLVFYYVNFPLLVNQAFGVFDIRHVSYLADYEGQRSVLGPEFLKRAVSVILIFLLVIWGKVDSVSKELILKLYLLSVFFYIGFTDAKFISDRVGGLFGFVEPMIYIYLYQAFRDVGSKYAALVLLLCYGLLDFLLRGFYLDSLPSHFIL